MDIDDPREAREARAMFEAMDERNRKLFAIPEPRADLADIPPGLMRAVHGIDKDDELDRADQVERALDASREQSATGQRWSEMGPTAYDIATGRKR